MNITVNRVGLNRTETIAPPLRNAITIPIYIDGHEMIVYVARGAFTPILANEGRFVKDVANCIATAIEEYCIDIDLDLEKA